MDIWRAEVESDSEERSLLSIHQSIRGAADAIVDFVAKKLDQVGADEMTPAERAEIVEATVSDLDLDLRADTGGGFSFDVERQLEISDAVNATFEIVADTLKA